MPSTVRCSLSRVVSVEVPPGCSWEHYERGPESTDPTDFAGSRVADRVSRAAITGRAGAVSTSGGVAQALAALSEPRGFELDDVSAKGVSGNRVDIVEVDDAIRWDAVIGGCEFEFGDESSNGARDRRHDDGSDAIGDWVSGEHEYWAIAAGCRGEPHLTALHRPSPPSLPPVPSRRSGRWLTRRR